MRKLSNEQYDKVDALVQALPFLWHTPYVDAEDLDDICLDGNFSLENLRALVHILTICEAELLANPPTVRDTEETITIPSSAHGFGPGHVQVQVFDNERAAQALHIPKEALTVDPETGDIILTLANGEKITAAPPVIKGDPVILYIPDPNA